MNASPVLFFAIGRLQPYRVPASGHYVIVAAGAQGGDDGGRGARIRGTFRLHKGELLQILVGHQGTAGATPHRAAGGGGGGTFVWRGALSVPLPDLPLLAAGGGGGSGGTGGVITPHGDHGAAPGGRDGNGGESDLLPSHYSGGGGAGWRSAGDVGSSPTFCGGGSIWRGGAAANYCCNVGGTGGFGGGGGGAFLGEGSGGGGGFSGGGGGTQAGPGGGGGGSFNAGADQENVPAIHEGDGLVSLTFVPEPELGSRLHVTPASDRCATLEPLLAAEAIRAAGLDPDFLGFC